MPVPYLERMGQHQRLVRHPIALPGDHALEVGEVVGVPVVVNFYLQIAATICRVVVRNHRLHLAEGAVGQFDLVVDLGLINREGNHLLNERSPRCHAVVPRLQEVVVEGEEEIEVVALDVVASEVGDGRSTTLVVYHEHLYEYYTLYIFHWRLYLDIYFLPRTKETKFSEVHYE